ncbi:hypothetical protein GEMRC1_001526 [Eukaryota sp. GEM-RC1]
MLSDKCPDNLAALVTTLSESLFFRNPDQFVVSFIKNCSPSVFFNHVYPRLPSILPRVTEREVITDRIAELLFVDVFSSGTKNQYDQFNNNYNSPVSPTGAYPMGLTPEDVHNIGLKSLSKLNELSSNPKEFFNLSAFASPYSFLFRPDVDSEFVTAVFDILVATASADLNSLKMAPRANQIVIWSIFSVITPKLPKELKDYVKKTRFLQNKESDVRSAAALALIAASVTVARDHQFDLIAQMSDLFSRIGNCEFTLSSVLAGTEYYCKATHIWTRPDVSGFAGNPQELLY